VDYNNQAAQASPDYPPPSTQTYASGTIGGCVKEPYRVTAQDAIQQRLSELRLQINQLEALSRALPRELPYVADEALRSLVNLY
jgi:hypothetical protein